MSVTFFYTNVKQIVRKWVQKEGATLNRQVEEKLGQNIRNIRLRVGLTQEMLAAKLQVEGCDITRSALAKIEVGQRHVYPDELMLLKKILGVTYDDLLSI